MPQDGSVNEAGLQLVIDEEKAAGKLPSGFSMEEILVDRFVKDAAQSVNQRFGSASAAAANRRVRENPWDGDPDYAAETGQSQSISSARGVLAKGFELLIDEIRGGLIGFKLLTHQWRAIGAANPFDAFRSAKELPVGPARYFGQLFSR
jgi:hypothetical protein